MPTYLHPNPEAYGVTKPVIFWQHNVAVLTPSPNGPIIFGGPLPKGKDSDRTILHCLFSIPTAEIPLFQKLKTESLPLIFPFRHDGGTADYTVARDGSVSELKVEPPNPTDGWPYPEYPLEFGRVSYECSEFEPINEGDSLRLLHQDPLFDADRDILVIIPSRSNDPSLPINLWNDPQDEGCVQCVFIFNTETNKVTAFNDVG